MNKSISAIIVQARIGSSRLKSKVVKPLLGDKSILSIVISRLRSLSIPIIVATTTKTEDDVIANFAQSNDVLCFRGDENDVLQRFIDCTKHFSLDDFVVRVCSDNPFVDSGLLFDLIDNVGIDDDYVTYTVNEIPVIKTHFGFFAEIVKVDALKKIAALTNDSLYREHVTNYTYTHPDIFKIKTIELQELSKYCNLIRLTIDKQEDFDNVRGIAEELSRDKDILDINWRDVIKHVESQDGLLLSMKNIINENIK